jgi:hypothetical protein
MVLMMAMAKILAISTYILYSAGINFKCPLMENKIGINHKD